MTNCKTGILGFAGGYSGNGGFSIQGATGNTDRAILELPGSIAADVAFDANFGPLLLDSPASYTWTISRFGNNTIVLTGVANAANATLSGNVLSLKNTGGTIVQAVTLAATSMLYTGATFSVAENGGNTQATVTVAGAVACFAEGTRIAPRTAKWRWSGCALAISSGPISRTPRRLSGPGIVRWIAVAIRSPPKCGRCG